MIQARNLRKTFRTQQGQVHALDGVSFEVKSRSFFTLLGPSGCGKTTTLRCVAGLEKPNEGEIKVEERVVYSSSQGIFVPGNKRGIGMVFQSYAIWPHMTVFKNVAYPLRAQKYPREEIPQKVAAALKHVGMEGLEERLAPRLSGGQQQRIALARALVAEPHILLLDEPLSNLDAKLRNQMRWELKELQSRLGTTTLYVTHDQIEALAISDEIALMNKGKIVQIGTPEEIYGNPADEFAADFIGAANLIKGELLEGPDSSGRARVKTEIGEFWANQRHGRKEMGKEILVAFRPEEVILLADGDLFEGENILRGEVTGVTYLGESTDVRVLVGDQTIILKGTPGLGLRRGDPVRFRVPEKQCLLLPRGS